MGKRKERQLRRINKVYKVAEKIHSIFSEGTEKGLSTEEITKNIYDFVEKEERKNPQEVDIVRYGLSKWISVVKNAKRQEENDGTACNVD